VIISPEHSELNERYKKLLLKSMQLEKIIEKKDEDYKTLYSKFTPLSNRVDKLAELVKQVEEEKETLLKLLKEQDQKLQQMELLKHQLDQLQRLIYARSTEKSSQNIPGQLVLGIDAEVVEACNINDGQKISSYTKYKTEPKKHPGRNQIPAHIPRVVVELKPDNLPEGAELFDKEETEQLEYDPAKLFATVYRRLKYKLTKPDGTTEFFIAPLPEEKDKNIAAPSLRAHHIVEKYAYHTPIYRQIQKLREHGFVMADSTIIDRIHRDAYSLTALYDEHRKSIVKPACGYMMADETSMTVLDSEKGKGKKSHIGYMWAYCNPVDRLVFFEYQKGRGNKHARPVLQHYKGYLHTDGYGVYKHFGSLQGVTHVCCNAHARRKFFEAKFTDKKRAEHVLMLYGKMYGVESYCKEMNLSFDERHKLRQEKSKPVFEELAAWVREEIPKVTTLRSPIGKALAYFSEREKQLGMFLTDGMLLMDTNLIENSIRPIALGRNNYLFAGSHDAAQNAAIIYSFFATCKLHDVSPYHWLKNVLTLMPTFPASRMKELLPQNWNQFFNQL
jgi:transposase